MTSSAGNAQKTPIARSLERFLKRGVEMLLDLTGMSLPCSVTQVVGSGIVKIKFEVTGIPFTPPQIVVPVLAFEYVRYPIQVGCKGMVVSADAYLGGVSGLGGGTADMTARPNLANLAFLPLGSKAWSAAEDPNAVIAYGPNGVIIRTEDSTVKLVVSPTGVAVTLPAGGGFAISNLPVVPGASGTLYNDGGTVKVSP